MSDIIHRRAGDGVAGNVTAICSTFDPSIDCSQSWKTAIGVTVFLSIAIGVVGVCGNVLIIVVFNRKAFSTSSTAVLLQVLACFDSGTLVIGMVINVLVFRGANHTRIEYLCIIGTLVTMWQCSNWTLVVITAERLTAVFLPHKMKVIWTRKRCVVIEILLVLTVITFEIIGSLKLVLTGALNSNTNETVHMFAASNADFKDGWVLHVFSSLLPSIPIVCGNSALVWKLWNRKKKMAIFKNTSAPPSGGRQGLHENSLSSRSATREYFCSSAPSTLYTPEDGKNECQKENVPATKREVPIADGTLCPQDKDIPEAVKEDKIVLDLQSSGSENTFETLQGDKMVLDLQSSRSEKPIVAVQENIAVLHPQVSRSENTLDAVKEDTPGLDTRTEVPDDSAADLVLHSSSAVSVLTNATVVQEDTSVSGAQYSIRVEAHSPLQEDALESNADQCGGNDNNVPLSYRYNVNSTNTNAASGSSLTTYANQIHRCETKKQSGSKSNNAILLVISAIFFVTNIPVTVWSLYLNLYVWDGDVPDMAESFAYFALMSFAMVNSSANFVCYAVAGSRFRDELRLLCTCCGRGRQEGKSRNVAI